MGSGMSELCGVSELLLKRMRKPLFPDKIQGEAWAGGKKYLGWKREKTVEQHFGPVISWRRKYLGPRPRW